MEFGSFYVLHVLEETDAYYLRDTVDSVGLIPKQLPFTASNNGIIRTFRHAISLDERRAKFKPNFCKSKASESLETHLLIRLYHCSTMKVRIMRLRNLYYAEIRLGKALIL